MVKQILLEKYNNIEKERQELKKQWIMLKESHGNKDEIAKIGRRITKLTINQVHILIDLEKK